MGTTEGFKAVEWLTFMFLKIILRSECKMGQKETEGQLFKHKTVKIKRN